MADCGGMLHIGILAHSADGAALCFLEMIREAARQLGPHEHPEITLSILPMGPALEHYENNDPEAVAAHLARTAERLARAGCDFFACPDNTAHIALEHKLLVCSNLMPDACSHERIDPFKVARAGDCSR